MSKQATYALIIAVLILVVAIYFSDSKNKLTCSFALSQRPIHVQQNFITMSYSPSTTNIDRVDGNGHAIGNEGKVENEVV